MHHWRMTEMEKLHIMEQLRAEELCTKKARFYLTQTRDPAIQGLLQQCIDKGQRHISTLNNLLRDAGLSGMAAQH
ncbi:hypothetical protein [Desulfofundulus salinus]|uniref:Spore coat protein n=1 Tax=Desulfofundulus salinus TaxID=2419843 RepID=A0A494WZF2_9FIRM|nr:hypothetical protein [Desulfofundulus salinum]RKO66020.1 hypothetical protein D7024_03030 [Desulfofundulus salinum]